MEKDIAQLQRRLKRSKIAVYAIVAFLALLTLGLLITAQRVEQEEALQTNTEAQTYVVNPNVPGISQAGCVEPSLEGCGQRCYVSEDPPPLAVEGAITCPDPLECKPVACPPGQVCDTSYGTCVNPNCEGCDSCRCENLLEPCPYAERPPGVYLYEDIYLTGQCYYTDKAIPDLGETQLGDNNLKSIMIVPDLARRVRLYRDPYYQNPCLETRTTIDDLSLMNCGFDTSSLVVKKSDYPTPDVPTAMPSPSPTPMRRIPTVLHTPRVPSPTPTP